MRTLGGIPPPRKRQFDGWQVEMSAPDEAANLPRGGHDVSRSCRISSFAHADPESTSRAPQPGKTFDDLSRVNDPPAAAARQSTDGQGIPVGGSADSAGGHAPKVDGQRPNVGSWTRSGASTPGIPASERAFRRSGELSRIRIHPTSGNQGSPRPNHRRPRGVAPDCKDRSVVCGPANRGWPGAVVRTPRLLPRRSL